jgi:DNA polymerase epsilon subunit 1
MSKTVEEYGGRKSSAITTARRLAQFLGDDRLKDKGLVCNYITAWYPPPPPLYTPLYVSGSCLLVQ